MTNRAALCRFLIVLMNLAVVGCPSTTTVPTASKDAGTPRIGPRLEIKETNRNVGEVDFAVPSECKFLVRNVGGEPLTLSLASKSCLCLEATLPNEIAPGQEGTIVGSWTPIPGQVGSHRASWDIATNDPSKPTLRLEVTGTVAPLVRVWPENISYIDFDHLEPRAKCKYTLTVFSTKLPAFDLDATLSSPGIKVTKSKLDLNGVSPVADAKPTAGYSVILETTPELPPGSSFSDLILTIKPPDGKARTIAMRVYAVVANGLFRVTPDEVAFTKPQLADGDVKKVLVQFFETSQKQTLKIVKSEPAFLQCDPPRQLSSGLWEFTVRIPAKNADVAKVQPDHFFEGSIVLGASGSDEQVPVRVKWLPPELPEKR